MTCRATCKSMAKFLVLLLGVVGVCVCADDAADAGVAFLAENGKDEAVTTLPSGLQFLFLGGPRVLSF